jgi:carboxyl-terminal processing protease
MDKKNKVLKIGLFYCSFEKYLSKIGIALNLNKNNAIVNRYITAEFARQLFGENQYYQIVLKEDTMIKAVLKH